MTFTREQIEAAWLRYATGAKPLSKEKIEHMLRVLNTPALPHDSTPSPLLSPRKQRLG